MALKVQLKSTLTLLFAVLFLSLSCAGPGCAASCELKGEQSRKTVLAEAVLSGCDGMSMAGAERNDADSAVLMSDCCRHHVCGRDEMVAMASTPHPAERPAFVVEGVSALHRSEVMADSPLELATHSPPKTPPKRNAILRI